MSITVYVRNFTWEDVSNTVLLINKSNSQEKTAREITEPLFVQSLKMPGLSINSDFFVAVNKFETIVGFMKIVKEPNISRCVIDYTLPNDPGRSQVFKLFLDTASKCFRKTDLNFIHVQVAYYDSDLIEVLKKNNFGKVKKYWTYLWKKQTLPSSTLPDGFSLTHFVRSRDEAALTSLQNESFSRHWGFAPNTIEEITARVSMQRNNEAGIIILKEGDNFAGYNWTLISETGEQSVGWISMTGIHPNYRGQKLGKEIVLAGMLHLKKMGVEEIELEVDSDNIPANKLYLNLGFEKIATTYWFENQHRVTK